ncbi:MAG: hypothetical protein IKX46_03150 [Verrucomicrobia bacterium]|nr:hypothetical protein [Verrucomicrobiota bacterium]
MKFIIKTTLLGGFTGTVWYGVFILTCLIFHKIAFWISFWPISTLTFLIRESYNLKPDTVWLILLFFPYIPGLVLGMVAGFGISLYGSFVSERIRKKSVWISSLKYRTRSFLSYCLFLGESTLCIAGLGSLFLCIMGVIFSAEQSIRILYAIDYLSSETFLKTLASDSSNSFIKLIVAILLAIFSALVIWMCEVYIAKEKQDTSQNLPEEQQQETATVVIASFVILLGVLLVVAMALYMLPLLLLGLISVPLAIFWRFTA